MKTAAPKFDTISGDCPACEAGFGIQTKLGARQNDELGLGSTLAAPSPMNLKRRCPSCKALVAVTLEDGKVSGFVRGSVSYWTEGDHGTLVPPARQARA